MANAVAAASRIVVLVALCAVPLAITPKSAEVKLPPLTLETATSKRAPNVPTPVCAAWLAFQTVFSTEVFMVDVRSPLVGALVRFVTVVIVPAVMLVGLATEDDRELAGRHA